MRILDQINRPLSIIIPYTWVDTRQAQQEFNQLKVPFNTSIMKNSITPNIQFPLMTVWAPLLLDFSDKELILPGNH